MGLTAGSTGGRVLEEDIFEKTIGCNYTIRISRKSKCRKVYRF